MSSYPIQITVDITDEYIEQIIDAAGTGIAYWAEAATVHRSGPGAASTITGYTVEWGGESDGYPPVREEKKLKPKTIADTVSMILTPGKVKVSDRIRKYIATLDPCDIDDDVADVIIQVALFGEIVYG